MPTKQPLDYARHDSKKIKTLRREYAIQSTIVTLLFIAVIMLGLKLIGDAMESNKQMKACQQVWVDAKFTKDEAKSECKR